MPTSSKSPSFPSLIADGVLNKPLNAVERPAPRTNEEAFNFKRDVQMWVLATSDRCYGVQTNRRVNDPEDCIDVCFWLAENEQQVILTIAPRGWTADVAERALKLARLYDETAPDGGLGFTVPMVALPGQHAHVIGGYELDYCLGSNWWSGWYVSRVEPIPPAFS